MQRELTVDGIRQMAAAAGVALDEARAARLLPLLTTTLEGLDAVDEHELEGVEPASAFSLEDTAAGQRDA